MTNNQNRKYRLRVYYKKTGRAVYLSHLETIRSIDKIIRRANLPYAITQGYSPHMKISFEAALSLGVESHNQLFDLYLNEYIKDDKALSLLQDSSTEDLWPFKCEYVDNDLPALGSIYGVSNYVVKISGKIDSLEVPGSFIYKRKKKDKVINIEDYLVDNIKILNNDYQTELSFSLNSSSSGTLNPEVFVKKLLIHNNLENIKIINIKKL